MRPSKHLSRLRHKTNERHLEKLSILSHKVSSLPLPESDRTLSYVAIQCLNAWANFARAYFLSCTLSPWRENGLKIQLNNRSIRTFDDAMDAAIKRCRNRAWKRAGRRREWNRHDEPQWYKPDTLINSCDEIGCSNHMDIQSALSGQTKVFDHLPIFRNFYAHRNENTAVKAKQIAHNYSIPLRRHPTEILLTPAYGRPQILILDWIDDIGAVVEFLCK